MFARSRSGHCPVIQSLVTMTSGASAPADAIERVRVRQHDGIDIAEQRILEHRVHLQRGGVAAGGELHAQPLVAPRLRSRRGRGRGEGAGTATLPTVLARNLRRVWAIMRFHSSESSADPAPAP